MYPADTIDGIVSELEELDIFTLSTSVDPDSFVAARDIADRTELVVPGFGVHPWESHRFAADLASLDEALASAAFIGEIGLDHRWVEDASRYPGQREVFDHQLASAARQAKLVNVHTAGAEQEALDMLAARDVERVIVHWYSGPDDVLEQMIDRGFYFTVGVALLHTERIPEVAAAIPLDRLLTETDNPGGLEWIAGEVGRPRIIPAVVERLAAIKRVGIGELTAAIRGNLVRLFDGDRHLDPWIGVLSE